MQNAYNFFNQFMQNPMAMLSRKYNFPKDFRADNPNDIIQYLLNTNQISQEQVNYAMRMRNHPMFKR